MADLPKSAKYYSDLPEEENVYDADHVFVLDNGNGARVTTEKFVDTVADKAGVHDMVSDEFDEEKEYSAGDYCIYENTLYKFTEDKEAGEWDTEIVEATTVSGEIKENTDLIDSSGIIKAGDSIDFVDVVTPIIIYNGTVYGRFNIGCPISATNVSWTMTEGTNATIRGQGSQYSGVDFSDASFGSLEIDEFGGVYFRFTTSNIPSGMSNYQVYLAWFRGTLTFS